MSDTNGTADLVFVNGPVYTVDASRSWAACGGREVGHDRGRRDRRRRPRMDGCAHRDRRPGGTHAAPRFPGRAHPSAGKRIGDAPLQPERDLLARGIPTHHRGLRRGQPRRPVDPGRRLVHGRLPRRDADQRGARRDRPRPAGDADQSRRTRSLGQLPGAGPCRDHAGHAGSGRRAHRANARWRTVRHPPRGSDALGRAPSRRRIPTRTTPRGCGWRRRTCTHWGSPPGRTRSWASTTATGRWTRTRRRPDEASSPRASSARSGGTGTAGSTRSNDWSTHGRARRSGGSRRPA